MVAMIRTSIMALLAFALPICAADAATFSMKRGINLDIWETWPGEDKWGDANVILPFPEWRKRLGEDDLKALKAGGFDVVRIPVDPSVFLSEKTVRNRVSEILAKMRARTRAEAVARARDAGVGGQPD